MKKTRYTLNEAKMFFPLLIEKNKNQEGIKKLEKTLKGQAVKKKVFKKGIKNSLNKIIPFAVLVIPFDFRRSFNYKGLSNYIFNNSINYRVPLARRSQIYLFVCFGENCNRKFFSLAKGRDLRKKCKSCRVQQSHIYDFSN